MNVESSWEWAKARSKYHFDDNIVDQEGDWFQVLGYFDNPKLWKEERDCLVEQSTKPITWETRKYYKNKRKISPMLEQEEHDIVQGGGNPKTLQLTNMTDDFDDYPTIKRMIDYFGVVGNDNNFKVRSHVQVTGQMFNYHIDKLWDRGDPDKVCRITFFLDDWKPGQFYMYGTYVYDRWCAGEAHIFDWPNVPHATANASNHVRAAIQITGLKTEKTENIIKNGNGKTKFFW
jgi:hypothetical protein